MSQFLEYAGLFIIIVWALYRGLSPFVSNALSMIIAVGVCILIPIIINEAAYILIAAFAPFGMVLPAIALQNMARKNGFQTKEFQTSELTVFLCIYFLFLCASLGVFTFDPYPIGYMPLYGNIITVILCLYTLWRGYYVLAAAIVLGQLSWALDYGSSNIFDHLTHALLVPVIVVTLLLRIKQRLRPKTAAAA